MKWFSKAEYYLSKDRFNTEKQYDDAVEAVKSVSILLDEAKKLDDNGKTTDALLIWHDVFGSKFPTVSEEGARSFGEQLSKGTLRYSATAGLSTNVGRVMGASKGFYGEE